MEQRTRKCAYQGVRNVRFSENWRALFSWNTRFEIRFLALLPTNSRMNQVKFVDENRQKYWNDIICLNRPYNLNYFKGCLQQILL